MKLTRKKKKYVISRKKTKGLEEDEDRMETVDAHSVPILYSCIN